MFSFEMFINKMQRFSEEKVKSVVYANSYGNFGIAFIVSLVLLDLLNLFVARLNVYLYYFLFIVFVLALFVFISGRKVGLAITENRVVYVKFNFIGYKEKEIFEVPFDNIKYITVRKILFMRFLKMSFISNIGKLERIRLVFSSVMIGPGSNKFKENSKEVYKRLVEVQKVVDRGDF